MTYTVEQSLRNFEFWSGGKDTADYLTWEELDEIEEHLEVTQEMMSDNEINDFFWFESDTIAEWLGYRNFEELMEERKDWVE